MLTVEKALGQVRDQAERIRNDETAEVGTVSRGDVVRQGDLYLVCVTGLVAKAALRLTKQRQLAPGTTQGSRHVVQGKCRVYEPADAGAVATAIAEALRPAKAELFPQLVGPVIEARGPVEIDHPEHGNRVLPGGEWYAVVYQRAFADEVRRQQD